MGRSPSGRGSGAADQALGDVLCSRDWQRDPRAQARGAGDAKRDSVRDRLAGIGLQRNAQLGKAPLQRQQHRLQSQLQQQTERRAGCRCGRRMQYGKQMFECSVWQRYAPMLATDAERKVPLVHGGSRRRAKRQCQVAEAQGLAPARKARCHSSGLPCDARRRPAPGRNEG